MCPARNRDEHALAVVPPTLLRGLSDSGAVIRALFGFFVAVAADVAEAIGATTAVAAADAFFGGAVIGTRFLGITGAVGLAGSAAFAFGATSATAFADAAVAAAVVLVGFGACLSGLSCRRRSDFGWCEMQIGYRLWEIIKPNPTHL